MSMPAPATLPVTLDPAVRVRAGGRLLVGGSPMRLISLTQDGARVVARWRGWAGPSPVGERTGERRVKRCRGQKRARLKDSKCAQGC